MSDEKDFTSFGSAVSDGARTGRLRSSNPAPLPANEDEEKTSKDASMWAVHGTNFFPCDESVKGLPPGQYEVVRTNTGIYFQQKLSKFDELIPLPDSASDKVFKNIQEFWAKEEHFRKFGYLWKRGILLWGPPGSGKTCTLQMLSQAIIALGGISVYVNQPSITAQGLHIFRKIEPNRPCVVLLEDIDAMLSEHPEHEILALLDGELQIDNVVFVATTNYPERLDRRIANRPSRFDIVQRVGMPEPEARRMYILAKNTRLKSAVLNCSNCSANGQVTITNKLRCSTCVGKGFLLIPSGEVSVGPAPDPAPKQIACTHCIAGFVEEQESTPCGVCKGVGNAAEIDIWIKETEGFSIAHIKELIVSVEIFEIPISRAAHRLRAMSNTPKSTDVNKDPGQYM